MGFLNRLREGFARFMSGRYGSDQLNLTLLYTALIMTLIGSLAKVPLLSLLADALLILMFFMYERVRSRTAEQ